MTMEVLAEWVSKVSNIVWNGLLLYLLVGTGIVFTIRTRFIQVRKFGAGWKHLFGHFSLNGEKAGADGMSPFQALTTAIAAQVGTGNIAGAATALYSGGPGAIFWMWLSAFFGMSTIYGEAVLAQKYKTTDERGHVTGGPIYYIRARFQGGFGKFLAGFFSVAIIFALGFTGNMVQANSISVAFKTAFGAPQIAVGIVCALIAAFIFLGGVGRIASVTEKVVPIMALFYMAGCVVILCFNHAAIIPAFKAIFVAAFDPQAILGGAVGITVREAMRYGVARGLFSNEAGMGSTPHAHALAEVRDPHEQGVVAMIGVFVDTIIVVTMTALVVLSVLYVGDGTLATGDYATLTAETITKTNIAQLAFGQFFGANVGAWFVAICLLFFAFSTILSWNLFAKLNVEWLFGKKAVLPFTIIALAFIFMGSLLSNDLVWELADMFNQLMVIPNAIALFALSGAVLAIANAKHDKRALDAAEERLEDQERAAINAMVEEDKRK